MIFTILHCRSRFFGNMFLSLSLSLISTRCFRYFLDLLVETLLNLLYLRFHASILEYEETKINNFFKIILSSIFFSRKLYISVVYLIGVIYLSAYKLLYICVNNSSTLTLCICILAENFSSVLCTSILVLFFEICQNTIVLLKYKYGKY